MIQQNLLAVAIVIAAAAAVATLGWLLVIRPAARRLLDETQKKADQIVRDAERDAEARRREADLSAKEKLLQARSAFERVGAEQRRDLETRERRQAERQREAERRQGDLHQREREVAKREDDAAAGEKRLEQEGAELGRLVAEQRRRLEEVAGLTAQQAKEELRAALEDEARIEAAKLVRRIEDEARERGTREAQRIIAMAIERSASDYVNETTVSVVMLPNDEMKGRIIGREGRNIRALEMATGVDLIVDDTPEAVILSGFDPFRREIARVTLERLITDGRIHPARIEEVVEKVKAEFEELILQEGQNALLELNLAGLHPDLVRLLGRLRYRTSYGQNVLQHSKEVAFLAAHMAAELRCNAQIAKRAGLLHDIGKAVDREMEGTHLELGIELLRKYGEREEVVHAMACHHGDYDPQTVEAVLVTAADALSAARPGARREVLETYLKRLERLEGIANDYKGVNKSYAIQAGREIRIIVDCSKVTDDEAVWLSKDIAKRIESELTYPGQIKVTVIRESRAIEYAR